MKLADTPDLGSGAAMREGSSPFIRTTYFFIIFKQELISHKFLFHFKISYDC
ncbi:hypothetical protein H0L94_001111 [Campylobacter jejuni]|nr:hypothetical protein [Campylobacter jejuni]EFR2677778.1 hypothetical protein [Campylobacter jejuni]EFR2699859.1 hypothetical protein [Campylobacter jejuni]EFR2732933.1 hypothetical protein [Campylobacter jejuni]EFR2742939.1 hypothetical protein [Campylobacter jejuni]